MFGRLRLLDANPVIKPLPPLPRPASPQPMIMYDKGLPNLPDDIICEIFTLLDMEALKSCSLSGKALSCSSKPFIHRTLYLVTPPSGVYPMKPKAPGPWKAFEGLQILSERGLLQHTRHISISLPRNPLFPHDLQPHIHHLRTIANLRSLKTRVLDVPSFIPKMEEYFGTFLGTLQSLELEIPRGDHKQILYFVSQFPNLRDLTIKGLQDYSHSMRNGGPHFDIKTSPPLDGTLDLQLNMNPGSTWSDSTRMGPQLFLDDLITLPSGLKPRILKISGYNGNNLQLLVDACAPSLQYMEFISDWFSGSFLHGEEWPFTSVLIPGAPQCPLISFEQHPALQKLEITLARGAVMERAAGWLSETLSTITSNAFTELTISIANVSYMLHNATQDQLRGWNSVDNVLDRLSLCEDVALVVKPQQWVEKDKFGEVIEKHFPLMWENGRVVLEIPPPNMKDVALKRIY